MRSLGIAIGRDRLTAVLRDNPLMGEGKVATCAVACTEPFGSSEDARRLAEEIRKGAGVTGIPPAVLTLPPVWTYLRRLSLPVSDPYRARKIHLSELEGNLPLEDEEIVSDLLPAPRGVEAGRFLAVAARRTVVEKTAQSFTDAGIAPDRIVTDHVALLCIALEANAASDALLLSAAGDVVVLRLVEGAVLWARHVPGPPHGAPFAPSLVDEIRGFTSGTADDPAPAEVCLVGEVPEPLSAAFPGARRIAVPGGAEDLFAPAFGAALAASRVRETGGFSLRTSAEAALEARRSKRRRGIAAVAAAAAVISAAVALETARWAEGIKVERVRAQIRREFSEAVPGAKSAVQETAQVRGRIQELERQRKELGADFPAPFGMLALVSQALAPGGGISVRELSFDGGRLKIDGEAESTQQVDAFRSTLAERFGPEASVTVQESGSAIRGSGVRFTVLIETAGESRA